MDKHQKEREQAFLLEQQKRLDAVRAGKGKKLNLGLTPGLLPCGHNSALLVDGFNEEGKPVRFCLACG